MTLMMLTRFVGTPLIEAYTEARVGDVTVACIRKLHMIARVWDVLGS